MMPETMSADSYYSELLDILEVKEAGIYRAMRNGEDPRKIEQERVDVLNLKEEIRELEAQGHSTSWW
jgi:hypothetical protein